MITETESAGHFREWLPKVGASLEEQIALFAKNSVELTTEFLLVESEETMHSRMKQMAAEWTKVGTHEGDLTNVFVGPLALPVCKTDGGYEATDLEACDVGITECDALIAQTGSVLLTARSAGGRALSVLPPHHVVLARRQQMLPDLPAAYALLEEKYRSNYPSFISLITGPSRTGDIERILVLGAHGPKRLTVFLLE